MPSTHAFPIEMRIHGVYGPTGGYFRLRIHSEEDAIQVAIRLRGLGMGLCYQRGRNMISWNYKALDSVIKLLSKTDFCRNAFFVPKGGDSAPPPLLKGGGAGAV